MPIRWRLTLLNAVMIGVILLTLAGSFAWLWYKHSVNQVAVLPATQAKEAATALEDGEDLLGKDIDELRQAAVGGAVVIVIRNAQGKVRGQMPEPPNEPENFDARDQETSGEKVSPTTAG